MFDVQITLFEFQINQKGKFQNWCVENKYVEIL